MTLKISVKSASPVAPEMNMAATNTPVPMTHPQAKNLNQLVKGTSSSYRVVAYSDQFVLAAKISGTKMSVRMSWTPMGPPTTAFMQYLKNIGFDNKGDYASAHLGFAGLTAHHVLAPLVYNPFTQWTQVLHNLSSLM